MKDETLLSISLAHHSQLVKMLITLEPHGVFGVFKKIIKRYIQVGYNLDVMRQSACLVLNPNHGLWL